MHRALHYLLLVAVFLSYKVKAQSNETDSLVRLLNKSAADTNKVHLYWKIGASVIYQEPQQAITYFKEGAALAQKLNFTAGIEKCYNATSLAFSINAKYDSALTYINYAVPYAIKAGNKKRLALAYLNRADVYNNLENYAAALKDCDTAITYAEKTKNNDGLGRIYSIINDIYQSLKQYEKAIISLDKSDQYFELSGNRQMMAMNYSERAEIFITEGSPEKAVPYLKNAIAIADSLSDIENLSAYYGSLCEAYFKLKLNEEAKAAANTAIGYTQQTGNTRQRAVLYDNLSAIALGENNFQQSIDYGLKAHVLIKAENDLLREQAITANLSEAYFKAGNTTKAYEFLKISNKLNDSLVKQQFSDETAKLQTLFEVKEKDKEIELLNKNKELQQQRMENQRLLLAGAFLLALSALAGIWVIRNRGTLKQKMKELELRNQIAADLHDEVGSSLSSIHMLSQIATQQPGSDTRQQDILSRMSTNAKETMEKMGDIVWMIKPGESDGANLKQRMERFAYEICSSKNIHITPELEELEKVKLSMEQRKNFYLVFKEALNNAVKYSGTEAIEIIVSSQHKQLTLQVIDHGQGFEPETTGRGNGLDNMKNRAKELGALLEIDSETGTGTRVMLKLPV